LTDRGSEGRSNPVVHARQGWKASVRRHAGVALLALIALSIVQPLAGGSDARAQASDCRAIHVIGAKRQVVDCPAGPGFHFCLTRNLIDMNGLLTGRMDFFQDSSKGSKLEQDPTVEALVGIGTITTETGVLEFSETGLSDTKSPKFVGIAQITSGTGDLAGYSGTLISMGDPEGMLMIGTVCKE
jgi:uncharacterized membrane protein